ncbi:hypothetical protein Glove_1032g11 [Diversispora epigaea]|uniref:ATP synthase subunit a n=1 Tax=Diversispora epigaea TaxID=1348612 RepID=A0A397G2L4_9GLOM|nr:hypothetical protein Glove_1032g11 [Diversispora epigaea]
MLSSKNLVLFNEITSPLDQFEIRNILSLEILGGSLHLSLTNIGFYLTVGSLIILIMSITATNYNKLVSMIPYSFASTGHFALTFALSFTIVLGATILGFQRHGLKFFSLFVPAGCPLALLPLLVTIELISYLARNVSLGLRLAANITAGHMLLSILSGFVYNIMNSGIIFFILGLIPLLFIIAFSGLELAIAFIQAQVFVVLSSSYIKDGLDLH